MDNSVGCLNDSADSNVSTLSDTGEVFEIHFSRNEFQEILMDKLYRQSTIDKKSKTRMYKIFVPGKWQLALSEKLWGERRIACGFMSERGRVYENAASIKGKAKFRIQSDYST